MNTVNAGQRFGKLTVVKRFDKEDSILDRWECLCDCGKRKLCSSYDLLYSKIESCGCKKHSHKFEYDWLIEKAKEKNISMSDVLTERHLYILEQRYAAGRTLRDIGNELGISINRVRQIEVYGFVKLRRAFANPDGHIE